MRKQDWVRRCFEALGWRCSTCEMAEWLAMHGVSMSVGSLHSMRWLVRNRLGKERRPRGRPRQPVAATPQEQLVRDLDMLQEVRNSYDDFPVPLGDLYALKRLRATYGVRTLLEVCSYLNEAS